MKKPNIRMKTENGRWYVRNGCIEIAFDNSDSALYFIDLCYKAVR